MLKNKNCKIIRIVLGIIPFIMVVFIPVIGSIIFISIICTAGVGLILYLPIMYFFGSFVQKIFFKDKYDACENSNIQQNNVVVDNKLTSNQKAVIKYILQVEDTINKVQIIENLYGAGWSKQDIENAFRILNK